MTLYVFKVDDGATHYVIANHPGEAIDVIAASNGQTRAAYCEEFPDHEIKRLEPHETVRISLDASGEELEALVARDLKVPEHPTFSLAVTARCSDWIATVDGPCVLCSTEV